MTTVNNRASSGGRARSKSDSWWVFGEGPAAAAEAERPARGDLFRSRERLVRRRPRPSVLCKFTRHQVLALVTLLLAEFVSFCSMSVMAPFFPREAALKGMSTFVSGLVFSYYALVVFATSPFFGKILPAVGAKFLFMAGMFLAGGSNVLFGVLPLIRDYTWFTSFCFLIRTLEAVGASAYATASFVFVVEIFPDNVSAVLGLLETAMGLGMSAGPAIGGLLYSVGGFGLPFYSLGLLMICIIPTNWNTLPSISGSTRGSGHGSFLGLLRIPSVAVLGCVVVVASNTWSFLDPTLEPHLSLSKLSSSQVGLIFLMYASLYGASSPVWGWLADKADNHWGMSVAGLLASAAGLLLLGPSPLLASETSLWMDMTGLCVIGVSVALTLMPTFQAIMKCAEESGLKKELSTYSLVAGAWSCMYSLGDMTGPALGGLLSQYFGFHVCTTVMAALSMITGVVAMLFFMFRCKPSSSSSSEEETSRLTLACLSDSEEHSYTTFQRYPQP